MGREEPKFTGDGSGLDGSLRHTWGWAGLLLGGTQSHSSPALPPCGCSCILEVKGTRVCTANMWPFSPSCTWLRASQSTCWRCSQIAMESRSSPAQVALEVTSPSPRGLVAAACSVVALPEIAGAWEEVTCIQLLSAQPPSVNLLLSTPFLVI